ncbi:cysteine desulfurase family protein [Evansella sp. AB-P1]|uniref:cysteine desulfurase family protein n=1 Tax=Evansella sp. AB-P1 TaxID=3037653 RepID=UPI00241DDB3D|nr:cysteine desulfurase family protein [Evansella sp. AB-P1]MDG5789947.1 cysteine desulfurase family protein [Evansella sp. AB-P1]
MDKVYLDYNASTPLDPVVVKTLVRLLEEEYGNPSNSHWAAKNAKGILEKARDQVASLISAKKDEIVFTSGGSESNNHALKGVYYALKEKGNHIITTNIEHPAIKKPLAFLEREGVKVTYIQANRNGVIDPEEVQKAITNKTILISIMHANNEVGTIQPIKSIGRIAKEHKILFHSDASQSLGKIPVNVKELGVDLLTVAGHKIYGPKGIGSLYIRKNTPIDSFIHGAGHEAGRRAGTESIMLAAGLGAACEKCEQYSDNKLVKDLRNYFWRGLQKSFGESIVLNGNLNDTLPNTLSVCFIGHIGQDILDKVPEVAASTGAACHTGHVALSDVLVAMGVTKEIGKGAVRFSLGRFTTKEEIDFVLDILKERI